MKARIAAAAAGAALAACVGDRAPTPPHAGRPIAAISDATHGGNAHFLWRPPIGTPSTSLSGVFNAHVAPMLVVEICELPACSEVESFTTADGLLVQAADNQYQVDWDTKLSGLDPDLTYRIRVLLREEDRDDFEYGFADVEVGRNASELRSVDRNQAVALVNGSVVPIKFRIDLGASCPENTDCVEAIVSPGTPVRLVTPERTAVLEFDGDEVEEPVRVTLFRLEDIIEDGVYQGHLGTQLPQYPLQYELLVNREDASRLDAFVNPALYGTCPVDEEVEGQADFHWPDANTVVLGIGRENFMPLERSDVSEFVLDGDLVCKMALLFQPSPTEPPIDFLSRGPWRDLLAPLLPLAAHLFGGEPLHASLVVRDALGGSVGDLPKSPIGPVDIGTTTTLATSSTLAVFGTPVTLTATVSPIPPAEEDPQVEFFDELSSLGTASVNSNGVAVLNVSTLALAPHILTARFLGTPSAAPSTSNEVTQHLVRRFDAAESFLAALGGAATVTQDFEDLEVGTSLTTLIAGTLEVTSPFDALQVFACGTTSSSSNHALFGFDLEGTPTRTAGEGRYNLHFVADPQTRNALAFDVTAQDPATDPATVEVATGVGSATFLVSNTSGSELIPTFIGMIATLPFTTVIVHEGPEVGGSGNEEICLDNFIVAAVSLP